MKRLLLACCSIVWSAPLFAQLTLGTPFSDGVVLQRDRPLPVWGKAKPGSEVTVSFADQEVTATASASGEWRVDLAPLAASAEGRTLRVVESETGWFGAETDRIEVRDVLVGEVWIASGQSNMDCPIWGEDPRYRDANGALVREMTRLPAVRYCKIPQRWSVTPQPQTATWRTLVPENVRVVRFSAIGFYFAREIHLALGVPIGLVDASWGGTSIDAWTPRAGYRDCSPALRETAAYQPVEKGTFPLKWKEPSDWSAPINVPRQQPTVIWNGMVDAWCPMAVRGVIWYQGCHNNGQAPSYCARMHALYNGWSRRFENPALSFHFAQLAPYYHNWMKLACAQAQFAAEEPHASMVTTADVGNFWDVHPNRKEVVAKRLAAQALRRDYGFAIPETDAPVLKSVRYDGTQTELTFDHAESLYVYSPDKSLDAAFELADTNGVWHAAQIANLKNGLTDGPTLVLTNATVAAPVGVRYMGKNGTAGTAYNQASLPLGPFEIAGGANIK